MTTATRWNTFVSDIRAGIQATQALTVQKTVDAAKAERDRVLSLMTAAHGMPPLYQQTVDGKVGAPLEAVSPNGVIVFSWNYAPVITHRTFQMLVDRSPMFKGEYIENIEVFADDMALPMGGGGMEYLRGINFDTRHIAIIATAPYSRRLEVGRRSPRNPRTGKNTGAPFVKQVKWHIVEETTIAARSLMGNVAQFWFSYSDISEPYMLQTTASHRVVRKKLITHMQYPTINIEPRVA